MNNVEKLYTCTKCNKSHQKKSKIGRLHRVYESNILRRNYVQTYFSKQNFPYIEWEFINSNGELEYVSNEMVVDYLTHQPQDSIIYTTIINNINEIEKYNGDINLLLKEIGKFMVENEPPMPKGMGFEGLFTK